MVSWRFGASSPAARVSSSGGTRKGTPTSFTTRIASGSSRVTLTLPLLSATLEWRAGCAERCKSGSGRGGREIVRLRPVSHSTSHLVGLIVSRHRHRLVFATSHWLSYMPNHSLRTGTRRGGE